MKIVVAGGSGALGRRLCADLTVDGHDVVVLTRRPRPGPFRQVEWDGRTVGPWRRELEGSAIVNLAGELVDRRPTSGNVSLLTRSRVEPTRALVAASATLTSPVPTWVQASTLAIYGDAGDAVLDESAPEADGPPQMAGVARAWEAAAAGANAERLVTLRTGIVLDNDTPALDRLWSLARWGLGGRVGPGTQWVSWIHVDDWLAVVREMLSPRGPALSGVVHATGPGPARNADLMAALRGSLGRPAAPPTPTALVRLGAVVLRTDPALALTGRRAHPGRLLDAGFEFRHPDLVEALADLRSRHLAAKRGERGERRAAGGSSGTAAPRGVRTGVRMTGWPELDEAMAEWSSTTASLPPVFRTELVDALAAVERGEVTLGWDHRSEVRAAFLHRFPHPFARAYARLMHYESLVLGLEGPAVRFPPVGGVILRRSLGEADGSAAGEAVDPGELAMLRALLVSITRDPAPHDRTHGGPY